MRRRTVPAAGLVVGLLLGLGIVVAPAAQAHDQLVGTEPADGTTVAAAPDKVTLSFEDPAVALGTVIEVKSPDGTVVSTGDPVLVDTTVSQAIGGDDLPAGTYSVTWRVTSQDGHAVSGTFGFVAAAAAASGSAEPSAEPSAEASVEPAPTVAPVASPSASSGSDDPPPALVVVGAGLLVGILFGLLGWRRARRRSAGSSDRP